MTRMTDQQEKNRALIENALTSLGTAIILKEHTHLRIQQAMQRDGGLVMLLEPAVDDIGEIEQSMRYAMNALNTVWENEDDWNWPMESCV